MVRMITLACAVVAMAGVASAIEAGASMGGKAKNSYSALMCEQEPSSWFCITNARRENLIKLKREGCTSLECPQGYAHKPDAASLTCKSMKAPTTTTQHTCDPENDRDVCCDKLMQCSDWKCPYGYTEKNQAEEEYCVGPQCQWIDVATCCDLVEPQCHEVTFAATPDGIDGAPATATRTCRKNSDREGEHSGDHKTVDSFLGWTNSHMDCFKLKTSQRSAMETTRIPNMPGPPGSGKSYGKPAPRPTTKVAGRNVVVDAAARGEEADLCQGFNCEMGGNPNASADNDWQGFLDISWNSFTGECHSCLPEKTVTTSDGSLATDPAAFRVSRAGQMNSITGDVNNKFTVDENGESVKAYPCKRGRGEVTNQVGGYEKDKFGEIIDQTGQGKTEAGRDASNKVVGEATHANFEEDMTCVNMPLDETGIKYDKVFDCNCPKGYYILNMRCVKFREAGYWEDEAKTAYATGKECLPSYGTKGKKNKAGKEKKVLSMNKYFPCDASKAVCADGSCVNLEDVQWDCETGFPCLPGSDDCKVVDTCQICGGDDLECHREDCEECYKNFKAAGKCQLADKVQMHIRGQLQLAKDKMELSKWKCKAGKTSTIRTAACESMAEGGDAYGNLQEEELEVEKLTQAIKAEVEGMDDGDCARKACWERVKNDCGRPDVCTTDKVQMLEGTFDGDGTAETTDDNNLSYKDVDQMSNTELKKKAALLGRGVNSFNCQAGTDSKALQEQDQAGIDAAQLAVDAAKLAAADSAQVGANEELCTAKCPEATEDMDEATACAACCPETGECVDELTAEANRDARLDAHEGFMVKVREAETALKQAEDKLSQTRLEYNYAIQQTTDVKLWGCVAQLSAVACKSGK